MQKTLYSVLVADVVGSTSRRNSSLLLARLLSEAQRIHRRRGWIRLPYAVTAGDEFQTIAASPAIIPELLFDLHVRLQPLRLRIGIGIGTIEGRLRGPVNRMNGAAFVMARSAIDGLKQGTVHRYPALTAFCTGRASFDNFINVLSGLQDSLLLRITPQQWEAIAAFRRSGRVDRAAHRLRLSSSTISRSLQRAGYWQLDEASTMMQYLLTQEFVKVRKAR